MKMARLMKVRLQKNNKLCNSLKIFGVLSKRESVKVHTLRLLMSLFWASSLARCFLRRRMAWYCLALTNIGSFSWMLWGNGTLEEAKPIISKRDSPRKQKNFPNINQPTPLLCLRTKLYSILPLVEMHIQEPSSCKRMNEIKKISSRCQSCAL